jgi:hypothetical protein
MINKKIYKTLNGNTFVNAQLRTSAESPYNVGQHAVLNFVGKDYKDPDLAVVIIADGKDVFRKPAYEVEIYFHEGWGGIDVIHTDDNGFRTTIILHYVTAIRMPKGLLK